MNEKLMELLETVRRTALDAKETAADVAYAAAQAGAELLSTANVNIRIAELKNEVNTALRDLGGMLYATHTGNPTDSEVLLKKLEEIDALNAQIAELSGGDAREEAKCPTCCAPVREGDEFCRECGGKL